MVPYDCLDFERVSIPSIGFLLSTRDSGYVAGALPFNYEGESLSTDFPSDDAVSCVLTFAADMNSDVVSRRCLNRPTPIGNAEKKRSRKGRCEKILNNVRHMIMRTRRGREKCAIRSGSDR